MNIYTICFLIILVFNIAKYKNSLYILKDNQYNEDNRYIKWIFNNLVKVFLSIDLLPLITILIAYLLNNRLTETLVFISIIFYLLELTRLLNNKKLVRRRKFVITKQVKRLVLTLTIILGLPILIFLIDRDDILLMVLVESILTYFSYFVVLIAKTINSPIEKIIYLVHKREAIERFKRFDSLNVIGITGSTNKTGCMNVISRVLNSKYITKSTPRNLNTEKGIITTINKYIDEYDQILVVEMGANRLGEINKMCNLVRPKYGLITNIDLSVSSVGSPEKMIKTQFELIESLDENGLAILNIDDLKQVSYNIKSKCRKIWIGIDNKKADINAKDIIMNESGTKFTVVIDNKDYLFETKLLGKNNVYNILSAIALGMEFKLSIKDLQKLVKKIKSDEAKLELVEYKYMCKIDDTYNKTASGTKEALEVLDKMNGEKIVVTGGFKDLGGKEKQLNNMFGTDIAKVADYVILINAKKTRRIFDGLLENGYDKDRLFVVNNVKEAYNIIKRLKKDKKIYALFEQI